MTLYDFDKTVYLKDSSVTFYEFCLKKKPYLIFGLPVQVFGFLAYKLGLKKKEYFKEKYFFFIKHFKELDKVIEEFWSKEEKNLCGWFLDSYKSDDMIVTASPEFLVCPIAKRLGLTCIGSDVDPLTARFRSPNCKGEEKVERLALAGVTEADSAYSDSASDMPMLKLAKDGFIIKNRSVSEFSVVKRFANGEEAENE